eukprot:g29972.t1
MLHFSSFHHKHIKITSPYGQALHIHRVCSNKEKHDGHLTMLMDSLIRMGYDAQLINHQFRRATAKNHNDLLRRETSRVPFIIQHFPRVEKLHHVLHSLQHIINDDEHFTKIFPTPSLLTFKQPPSLKQTIVCSKLNSLEVNINHDALQPCHSNLCKTCQIIDMDTTIT